MRCFSSPRSLPHGYGFTMGCRGTTPGAFPHLRNPRINACLAAPRGLSQLCHVFLRLWTPDHPPCTLLCLDLLSRSIFFDERFLPCFQRTPPSRAGIGQSLGGGGDGARTRDLRVANAMLFQLSYTPLPVGRLVGQCGIEPQTSRLSGGCSNR